MIMLQLWYVIRVHMHTVLRDVSIGAVETRISNLWNQKAKNELNQNKKQKTKQRKQRKVKIHRSFFTKTFKNAQNFKKNFQKKNT